MGEFLNQEEFDRLSEAADKLSTQLFEAPPEGLWGCGAGMSVIIVYFRSKKALNKAASEIPLTFEGFPVESMVCKGTVRPC